MKKLALVLINLVMLIFMMGTILFNVRHVRLRNLELAVKGFEDMTVTMEKVTKNYFESEQKLCNQWANYINSKNLTMEETLDFIRTTLTDDEEVTAHIVYSDRYSYKGYSSVIGLDGKALEVDYKGSKVLYDQLQELWGKKQGALCMSCSFENQQNGVQSVAFCSQIYLKEGKGTRSALLMRIIPVARLKENFLFPEKEFIGAQIGVVEKGGDYVIPLEVTGDRLFFKYLADVNGYSYLQALKLQDEFLEGEGCIRLKDGYGRECYFVHVPLAGNQHWVLLGYVAAENLRISSFDWSVVLAIVICLVALLAIDVSYYIILNRRLEKTSCQALAASRAKTEFLSTMSHDIRTPLNAILGMNTIAMKKLEEKEWVQVKNSLKKMNLASNHLLTLINDILDISKIESGSIHLSPIAFSLEECTENLVNIVLPSIREKNLKFSFQTKGIEYEELYADQLRINQVFINLLSNAVKYTKPGGKVKVFLGEHSLPGRTDRILLTYMVEDSGIGMTHDFIQRMYEPFSREKDSRVNAIQGTGLGLAITKKIVDLMGGTIECESREGRGTKFTVNLEIPVSGKAIDAVNFPSVRLLVVDEDSDFLYASVDMFKAMDVQVDTSRTGRHALELAEQAVKKGKKYDAIVLDWNMSDMKCKDIVMRLKENLGKSVPLLMVSGYDWPGIEKEVKALGIEEFIAKPMFKSSVYRKMSQLLSLPDVNAKNEEDEKSYRGVKILIAEDNDLNWEIISTMLSFSEIETERAVNGSKVIEMLMNQGRRYDLIFMDIQMPEMDGLEATRIIRQSSEPLIRNIPIVAMTADAFSENITACLEAGMNSHIAKPVDLKQVFKEIDRILVMAGKL